MTKIQITTVILGMCFSALAAFAASDPVVAIDSSPRERLSLDRGWLFHQGDIPFPVVKGHQMSYENAKAGKTWGAAAPDFDDSDWRTLDLPHDWAVEGPFTPDANISQGYRVRGIGWYRRYFRVDPSEHGKHFEVQFDGVATHCTVWINGVLAARNFCGYTSFYVDMTPFVHYGDDVNVIAVQVDADTQEGWWYEGAGMYRHTWLVKRDPVHLTTDGVFAQPIRGADGKWTVPVESTLYSSAKEPANVEVESVLLDPAGQEIGKAGGTATVNPLDETVAKYSIAVASPKLWSVDEPTIYSVRTSVKRDGKVIDSVITHCGFRTIKFDADKGFFLNDQPLKLKGVCNHQDHAGVGVAVPDSLWDFRLRRLKEMGVNAYRCAHNPPAAEFLDACDRLGILVMDENRNFNTTPEYVRQLQWLIRRDRNHPSVILWSVFNEEPTQGTEIGYEMVRRLSEVVKKLDVSRPVTAAQSGGMMGQFNASMAADVAGFNYQQGGYDGYHKANPTRPISSSEDTSAVETRGEYHTDKHNGILDSYDLQWQPWGASHRNAWQKIDERPFVAGGFVWTGFDYRGEPQPLEWPTTGSSFGIMDLCGFPKTAYYIHQACWIKNTPILQLAPHWNWAGQEGKPIKVMICSNAESVVLSLNGKPAGETKVDPYQMAYLDVPYEAGKLEAVASTGGKEMARFAVETTGAPAAVQLIPDRKAMNGDGLDAIPFTVQVVDAQGRPVPTANNMIKFDVSGPGSIIGLNNGDPKCHEPEKGNQHSLFNGLAQIIVQTTPGGSGPLTIHATADGLKDGSATVEVKAVSARPEVAAQSAVLVIGRWKMSPPSAMSPDPNQQLSKTDMNSWANVNAGKLQSFKDAGFVIYRAQFKPRANVRASGGKLVFKNLGGKAQVWLDGKLAAEKKQPEPAALTVPLAPGDADRTVSVLVEFPAGASAGLGGVVTAE